MSFNASEIFSINWIVVILGILTAFSTTWLIIPSIVHTSRLKHLGATSNGRTSHKNTLPNLGGIAVYAGFLISAVIFAGELIETELLYIICGLTIVLFLGIKDDILVVNPWKKLAGQIIATGIIVVLSDIRIGNFYGLFGITEISYFVSILFTVFVLLLIINGFNLIDGIDGLASGIGILTTCVFGIWFWMTGNIDYTVMAFSFCGSLMAFFYFNVFSSNNKLFLGDTGSLITGFVLGILACRFLELDLKVTGNLYIQSAPAVVIGIFIIPLFDTLRVFMIRLAQGKSPFKADRQHIHHRLLQLGITHLQATLILIAVNLVFITLCYILQGIGIVMLSVVIFGLASLMSYSLVLITKRKTFESIYADYVVEGTWIRKITKRTLGRTRHINNITLHYFEKAPVDVHKN